MHTTESSPRGDIDFLRTRRRAARDYRRPSPLPVRSLLISGAASSRTTAVSPKTAGGQTLVWGRRGEWPEVAENAGQGGRPGDTRHLMPEPYALGG